MLIKISLPERVSEIKFLYYNFISAAGECFQRSAKNSWTRSAQVIRKPKLMSKIACTVTNGSHFGIKIDLSGDKILMFKTL